MFPPADPSPGEAFRQARSAPTPRNRYHSHTISPKTPLTHQAPAAPTHRNTHPTPVTEHLHQPFESTTRTTATASSYVSFAAGSPALSRPTHRR